MWKGLKTLTLSTNMGASFNKNRMDDKFASLLLRIGNGKIAKGEHDNIVIPIQLEPIVSSIDERRNKVDRNIAENYANYEWLSEGEVSRPKNDFVHAQ